MTKMILCCPKEIDKASKCIGYYPWTFALNFATFLFAYHDLPNAKTRKINYTMQCNAKSV